ncbi:hypothetical protein LKK83_14020 [Phormidium sp. CCY1219]|nr:hypothetical protein [Phormidium sp. CCY1219]
MAKFISWLLSPKTITILIGVVLLYAISPFLITFAGAGLAGLFGCNGGGVENNCPSPQMAEFFTSMTVVHWLAMVTLPTGHARRRGARHYSCVAFNHAATSLLNNGPLACFVSSLPCN